MAIVSRAQLLKELLPGLEELFQVEYRHHIDQTVHEIEADLNPPPTEKEAE